MYISKDQALKLLDSSSQSLEKDYNEKLNFLAKLLDDDDWSFVIKSHSLIESLVTEIIIEKLNEPILKSFIERLPLHGDEISKIRIIKTYDLLSKGQITFIAKLSIIRNNIVHKFENLSFTFDNYQRDLNKDNLKNWKNALLESNSNKELQNKLSELVDKDPKIAVWLTLSSFINYSLSLIHQLKINKQIEAESNLTTQSLLKDLNLNLNEE